MAVSGLLRQSTHTAEHVAQLRQASPHWLRHTFAKAALLSGQDMRSVAAWLGHRDLGTTMAYTEQEALDLIRATNSVAPGLLVSRIDIPEARGAV